MNEQGFLFINDEQTEKDPTSCETDEKTKSNPAKVKDSNERNPGFEKSLKRLEGIVEEMEKGQVSLDSCMKHFEEGTKLARFCSAKLNETEKKIEILLKDKTNGNWAEYSASSQD